MKYTLSELITELQRHEPEHGSKTVISLDGDDNGNFYVDDLAVKFLAKIPVEHQLSNKLQSDGYFAIQSAYYSQD
jgi:hypothetical protein|tara:strand:+ start:253 stop:477 length:225 start_codon:yes stop_codon:yes gene_type:complete